MKKFKTLGAITILLFSGFVTIANAESTVTDDAAIEVGQDLTETGPVIEYKAKPIVPTGQNNAITLVNPLGSGVGLMELLTKILKFVIQIGTIVVIFMLVYVGYLFVAAQGKEEKIREARNALLWTIVGALILLGSEAIAEGIRLTAQALSVGK